MKLTTVFLDRDGVINRKPNNTRYVKCWNDFQWLPGAKEALRLLQESDVEVVIVTNQSGIGRGLMTLGSLAQIHRNMIREVEISGGKIRKIYFCPHTPEDDCKCRKPKPGMICSAVEELGIDLEATCFIGDSTTDLQAAEAANCRFLAVSEKNSLLKVVQDNIVRY